MRPKNIEKEEAIRRIALRIIAHEGLENLSMQKLAKEANISPQTIYIKYKNKEDLLIKLYIEEVLEAYEKALLTNFSPTLDFADGVRIIWQNAFQFLSTHREAFALIQYGKSSPLLNKAYQEKGIQQGQFFSPIHVFLQMHTEQGTIHPFPLDVQRAMLFAPLLDLVSEYFDYTTRDKQIITEALIVACSELVSKSLKR